MTVKTPIYLDNNATTRVDPRVVEAMLPYFTEHYGNAASRNHAFGWEAEEAVEQAREQVASLIGASAKEIVFTSGATESNNLAIKGVAAMYRKKGNHLITAVTEHKAVLDPCKRLERDGFQVTFLPVDQLRPGVGRAGGRGDHRQDHPGQHHGRQQRDRHAAADPRHRPALQAARRPVPHRRGAGRRQGADRRGGDGHRPAEPDGPQDVRPQGHRRPVRPPQGSARPARAAHRRRRPRARHAQRHAAGAGIVGFGMACELCRQGNGARRPKRLLGLRERLRTGITDQLDEVYLNGHPTERLPGNLNLSFAYVEGEALMMGMKDVAVSSGSACTSASLEPSYVLKALGVGDELAHSSIRFGLGRFNTEEEVDYVIDDVVRAVNHLREMSPLYEMHKQGIDLKTVQWATH